MTLQARLPLALFAALALGASNANAQYHVSGYGNFSSYGSHQGYRQPSQATRYNGAYTHRNNANRGYAGNRYSGHYSGGYTNQWSTYPGMSQPMPAGLSLPPQTTCGLDKVNPTQPRGKRKPFMIVIGGPNGIEFIPAEPRNPRGGCPRGDEPRGGEPLDPNPPAGEGGGLFDDLDSNDDFEGEVLDFLD